VARFASPFFSFEPVTIRLQFERAFLSLSFYGSTRFSLLVLLATMKENSHFFFPFLSSRDESWKGRGSVPSSPFSYVVEVAGFFFCDDSVELIGLWRTFPLLSFFRCRIRRRGELFFHFFSCCLGRGEIFESKEVSSPFFLDRDIPRDGRENLSLLEDIKRDSRSPLLFQEFVSPSPL